MTSPSSEAAVHSYRFLKISPENIGARVILLVKLENNCSEWQLYTKMTPSRMFTWKSSAWAVQKKLSIPIHFRKFFRKIPMVKSFFWLNYRLVVQSSDYILKWLHQQCFLENLPKAFGAPNIIDCKYLR